MRSHCALYVDAGYLLAAAATRVTGTSLRGGIKTDHERLIRSLVGHATDNSGLPLLRVHWYDAAPNGIPLPAQEKIALLPRVKLRLGRIGYENEQKGVDLRIGLDMVAHARNAAIDVIFLVSGDDDLTEAVEEAQAHGVQVIILAIPNKEGKPHGVSRHLHSAADGLELLAVDALDAAVAAHADTVPETPAPAQPKSSVPSPATLANRAAKPQPAQPQPAQPQPAQPGMPLPAAAKPATSGAATSGSAVPGSTRLGAGLVYSSGTGANSAVAPEFWTTEELAETIDVVVDRVITIWLGGATPEDRTLLEANRPSIPKDIDSALLRDLSDAMSLYDLSDAIRHQLRARFWGKIDDGKP